MSVRLGELLIRAGMLKPQDLERALNEQKIRGGKLGSNLVRLGLVSEEKLIAFLSKQFGVPPINLAEIPPEPEIRVILPLSIVERHQAVPLRKEGSTLLVAMSDPSNHFALDDIRFHTGLNIKPFVASEASIKTVIDHYYDDSSQIDSLLSDFKDEEVELVDEETQESVIELRRATEEAPVVKLVNLILTSGVKKGASDIHLEPYEREFRVRFRIDGVLHEEMRPPLRLKSAIASRVKVIARLDLAERRLPQDGRMLLRVGPGREVDFRVSVLPTMFGEKIVIRILDKSSLHLDLNKLGFELDPLRQFREGIYRPYGMVLVTGPTGSGKTTTLYSALTELNKVTENISTVEDPVEYQLTGINQVQVNDTIGLSFAQTLRALLRQDPDIMMVGEIRDLETAQISIRAALTGHLVLSTLHTNDAASSINRLLDMGIEPFLLTSAANLILAQRLVRKTCENCKKPVEVDEKTLVEIGVSPEEASEYSFFKGEGCYQCNFTGYRGRLALYEVMPLSEVLKELILRGATSGELRAEAMRSGMKTLRQCGLAKIKQRLTTVEEVARITIGD